MRQLLKNILSFYGTVAIPLIYVLGLVFIARDHTVRLPLLLQLIGLLFTVIGIMLWIVSYLNLGKSFGVLPRKQPKVQTGVYRRLKHPMYLAISLLYLGLGLANQSYAGLTFTLLVLLPLLALRAHFEEKLLSATKSP